MANQKDNKTTIKDFEYFVERCRHWQEVFQLRSWGIIYQHEDEKDDEDLAEAKAIVMFAGYGDLVATVVLNKSWGHVPVTRNGLDRCALHEVLEIFLRGFYYFAACRFSVTDDDLEVEKHRIIRTIENILTDDD